MKLKDFIKKGYYINLDYRTDRNENTINELKKYDLYDVVQRYPAIKAFDKTIKCEFGTEEWHKCTTSLTKTNIEIVKKAKEENLENILILEDDILFHDKEIPYGSSYCPMKTIEKSLDSLMKIPDWEIFYLGGSIFDKYLQMVDFNLIKVGKILTSHAFILNHRGYDKILNSNNKEVPNDILLNGVLDQKYSIYPCVALQRGGDLNDIGGNHTGNSSGYINTYLKPIENLASFI
jgi:glycosyl transferase family 25